MRNTSNTSNLAWDDGYHFGFNRGLNDGYLFGYNAGKDTDVSDKTPKSEFPKHLKTDKGFLKSFEKSKEECIISTDFERIHSVMKYLDWKWNLGDGAEVPSIGEIVISAQRYLNAAVKGFLENTCNEYYVYSGGLKASVYGSEDGFCKVTLEFIVSDCESTIGDEK